MKSLIALMLMTLVLNGCNTAGTPVPEEGEQGDRIVNPICDENSQHCDLNWVVTYKYEKFPKQIQILVNDKVIYTECGDLKYTVNRNQNTDTVEIYLWNYHHLLPKGATAFSFEIKNVVDCNDLTKLKTFSKNDPQKYTLDDDVNPTRAFLRN